MARFGFASSAGLVAAFMVAPSLAHAVECSVDGDCPKGWECKDLGGEICTAMDCDPDDSTCSSEPVCETVSDLQCRPGTCSEDTDCAEGMICYEHVDESCEDYKEDCADGGDCTTRPECDAAVQSACLPKWLVPCSENADCGAGFECIANQSYECETASSPVEPTRADGAGGVSDEGDAKTDEPECTLVTSEVKYCEPIEEEQTCNTDSDCPSEWTCEEHIIEEVSCSTAAPAREPTAGASGVDEDPVCETTTTVEKLCMPRYIDHVGSGVAGAVRGEDAVLGSSGDDDDGGDVVPTEGREDDDANTAADDDEDASGDDDDDALGSSTEESDDGCGCRVGPGRTSHTGFWLGALALVGLGLRRRNVS